MPLRPVRHIASIAAVVIVLVEGVHFLADDPEHFAEVYSGAVQMAHPEHWMGDSGAEIGILSTDLAFTADEYGSPNAGFLHGSISMNALRILRVEPLPRTKMTGMLQEFRGGGGADDDAKRRGRSELASLPDNVFATAIIELARPLDERQLDTTFPGLLATKGDGMYLFLSGVDKGMTKPVFWRSCAVYRPSECEQKSGLELYRRWVSELRRLDGIGLAQLDLDIDRLREAAREGRVYGMLTYGYPGSRLSEMLDLPAVRTIRIVETRTIG
ncbi:MULTISPECIES: hypothetical protein [unclassified Nonomuraea]|uniref:hypothetical protein n=1 Tax=unclassified Nonomuraea TaxID=2593643 RepID=UPI0033FEC83A